MNSVHIERPWYWTAVVLTCIAWPVIAFALLQRRGRSSGPVAAVTIPMAIAVCGTWVAFFRVISAMAPQPGPAAVAAGVSDALSMLSIGGWSAAFTALAALLRRHRPLLDRGTAVTAALLILDIVAAFVFAHRVQPALIVAAWIGVAASLAIALAAASWWAKGRRVSFSAKERSFNFE